MSINQELVNELETEAVSSRKMLAEIPADQWDWKPHEKSMSLGQLSTLVAMMFDWFAMMGTTDELDFLKGDGEYPKAKNADDLLKILDDGLARSKSVLEKMSDQDLERSWKLRSGETIHQEMSRYLTFRQTFSHLAHHRGQLSVYLRLKDLTVPAIYGPTADDRSFG